MYEDIFEQIHREAVKRNLKESTVAAYCRSVDYFLRTVNKDISALTTDDVDAFLTEKRLGGLAPQTYNHYHASIRFFYKRILKMNWDDEDIPRMKLDRSLPTVLSIIIPAVTGAAPCARNFRRKSGWTHAGKMCWTLRTSMWFSLSRRN
jgi:site-specific recombinase XerD